MMVHFPRPPKALLVIVFFFACAGAAWAQPYKLRGTVTDATTGETLIGATVVLKGTTTGTVTDVNGRFELTVNELPPYTLEVSYLGYSTLTVEVKSLDQNLRFKLGTDQVLLKETEVIGSRISEKQKQAPLTVESIDVIAIREAPSGDFYESLGNLKGVDMVAASFGFKVINTRGFNSTSPVRSLQLIDGVDNQSPGLNFSLGNFLGASDLDVMKVDVIAGASTAYFGPGAFNGVVNMTTKSPWMFPGLSVSAKGGQRDLLEGAVRWAQVIKDKDGNDRFAYKLNLFALRALDWFATSDDPTIDSPTGRRNPGRYDAVNTYGDENVSFNNDFTRNLFDRRNYPGLGIFLRPGYREAELVDYGTDNLKAGVALHYRLTTPTAESGEQPVEVIAAANYSRGSTVYQGENRYRLKDIQFWQQRLEVRQEGKWFLRGYFTGEDAGRTYDIFTTGVRLQEAAGPTREWNIRYFTLWDFWVRPTLIPQIPGWLTTSQAIGLGYNAETYDAYLNQFIADNHDRFVEIHRLVADSVNRIDNVQLDPFYEPGTARFNDKFDEITGKRFTEGGSLFFDRSQLAHAMGEYRFKPEWAEVVLGGNFRQYMPNSAGTIFRDTAGVRIRNREFGLYSGLEKAFMDDKLKSTVTLRMDKNQNFKHLFSPAATLVYLPSADRTLRVSFSSAIRNPTLADQYLFYNVGRAILLGNVDGDFEAGRDSLITVESFNAYRSAPQLLQGLSRLEYFNVDRLRPEQVRTIEAGYRGTHADKFYVDLSAYSSWYTDFIGYLIGISTDFDPVTGFPIGGLQVYRLAANSTQQVRTQGANVGVTYYRNKMTYGANYSYNELVTGEDDPIIPAFNTPRNKFNVSLTGHDMKLPFSGGKPHFGWGLAWRFIEGFTFEGSPQFTGAIPSYDMLDVQVNAKFPTRNLVVKLGCSNLFGFTPLVDPRVPSGERLERAWDNQVLMVFGGPNIGRLAYVQLIYELDRR
jgi:outer membrane receptor protein involved in Fe transport